MSINRYHHTNRCRSAEGGSPSARGIFEKVKDLDRRTPSLLQKLNRNVPSKMSFQQFDREMRPHLRRLYPGATILEINHALAMRWRDLSKAQQAEFVAEPPSTPLTRAKAKTLTPPKPKKKDICAGFRRFVQSLNPGQPGSHQRIWAIRRASRLWRDMSETQKAHFRDAPSLIN